VPHGVKLLTRRKCPVPVVPPVCRQRFVIAVPPWSLWPYCHDCAAQGGV